MSSKYKGSRDLHRTQTNSLGSNVLGSDVDRDHELTAAATATAAAVRDVCHVYSFRASYSTGVELFADFDTQSVLETWKPFDSICGEGQLVNR